MYWDFDRLSSSGQLTLDKIAELVGAPTEKEMNVKSAEELQESDDAAEQEMAQQMEQDRGMEMMKTPMLDPSKNPAIKKELETPT